MNYNKISGKEYDIHIIKNKKFHTVNFRIVFTEDVTKERIAYRNALIDILTYATKKYNTKEKLMKKCQDLYSLRPNASVLRNGNLLVTKFSISTIQSKYIESENLKENILLLKEILLNPLTDNKAFLDKNLNVIKRHLEFETKTIDEEPRLYANIHLLSLLDNGSGKILSGYTDIDILNKMTGESLYQSHMEMLQTSKIDLFISGNIENVEEITKIISDNFVFNNYHKKLNSYPLVHNIKKNKPTIIKEVKSYQQTKLSIGFKLYDLTEYENRYVSFVFNNILGGDANSLLLRLVREDNSLCYYIGSYINRLDNILIINSGINKENYDKVIELIKKALSIIETGKFSILDVNTAKMEMLFDLSNIFESNRSIIDYYYAKSIFNSDDINVRTKMIKKVSKKDIIAFSKKINIDSIFLLEGDL